MRIIIKKEKDHLRYLISISCVAYILSKIIDGVIENNCIEEQKYADNMGWGINGEIRKKMKHRRRGGSKKTKNIFDF